MGVYSFFLLFHFLQSISALWPADIHLIFRELSSAGAGSCLRLAFKQLTVTECRQKEKERAVRPLLQPHLSQSGKR
jgi:hypothetical protein